jgi:hypothetical protein
MRRTFATTLTAPTEAGTALGLAQRLARRDIPPAEWRPDDR